MSHGPESPLYWPLPAALELKHFTLEDIMLTDQHDLLDATLRVSNGHMPENRAVVSLGDNPPSNSRLGASALAAFDFVGIDGRVGERGLVVRPIPVTRVDKQSRLMKPLANDEGSGLIVLSTKDRVLPYAEVKSWDEAQWHDGFRKAGTIGIRHLGIDAPTYEVSETGPSGTKVVQPPRYF